MDKQELNIKRELFSRGKKQLLLEADKLPFKERNKAYKNIAKQTFGYYVEGYPVKKQSI